MDMREAMRQRHTVRKYTDKPISAELAGKLNERTEKLNREHGLSMKLLLDDTAAFGALFKLVRAKGVRNYFVLAGPDGEDLAEKLGYCSAELMLYAQTLGLNTWWVGGTFSRKNVAAKVGADRLVGIVVVGYGAEQGVPHKSKRAAEVSEYAGAASQWFVDGVAGALLAPTALNKQDFYIKGKDDVVEIAYNGGAFAGVDLGLVKYHFELAAGKDNFIWRI